MRKVSEKSIYLMNGYGGVWGVGGGGGEVEPRFILFID